MTADRIDTPASDEGRRNDSRQKVTLQGAKEQVVVTFLPLGQKFTVDQGQTLFDLAGGAGVEVDTVCGGNGLCGKCKVRIDCDPPPPCPADFAHLSAGEVDRGYRLACRVIADRDMVVEVPPPGERATVRVLHQGISREVALNPNVRKIYIPHTDPRGRPGVADWEYVTGMLPRKFRHMEIPLHLLRQLPACIRHETGMTLVTAGRRVIGLEPGNTTNRQYGVAFDIGSTTLVGLLIDLATGQEVAVATAINKQSGYGDDIIGRLTFAQRSPSGLARLHNMLVEQMNSILQELFAQRNIEARDICEVTVVGNMAMHHFFLKLDSTYLGLSPYAPVIRKAYTVPAEAAELELNPDVPIFILPNIAGFVGSDTVGVMLATGIADSDDVRMAIDVGTNGEIVLGHRNRVMACSSPAGPAFEGACIKMGMRAVPGAIEHVEMDEDVRCEVIEDRPPKGICGTAMLDIVAGLLKAGMLDSTGAFYRQGELPSAISGNLRQRLIQTENPQDTYFVLSWAEETGGERDVIFTQRDVREFQLAKGAMRAGAMVLQQNMGIGDEDLSEVLLAGAFGSFLDPASARHVGLTPAVPVERIRAVGNAAAVGAKLALISVAERRKAESLANRTEHIQLSGSRQFYRAFARAMQFNNDS